MSNSRPLVAENSARLDLWHRCSTLTATWREDYNHVRPDSSFGLNDPRRICRRVCYFRSGCACAPVAHAKKEGITSSPVLTFITPGTENQSRSAHCFDAETFAIGASSVGDVPGSVRPGVRGVFRLTMRTRLTTYRATTPATTVK
jgi:hypothetical protein